MRPLKTAVRALRGSLVGAVALVALCPLAMSANRDDLRTDEPSTALVGKLTSTGKFMIDGVVAQSGATVQSGSEVATGADGDAAIDLGPLGRVQLRPNTAVRLMLSPNNCQVLMTKCGSLTQTVPAGVNGQVKIATAKLAHVTVTRGEVSTDSEARGKTQRKTQKSGRTKSVYGLNEVDAAGEATFTVNCCQCCFVVKEQNP